MKKIIILSLFILISKFIFPQEGWRWQNPYLQGNDLNCIVMNGVVGWAVGNLGTAMQTKNSGIDWELVDLRTSENMNSIYMNDVTGDGWIVGDNGMIFYTNDAGENWVRQYSGTHKALYSISASGGNCPWICGDDIILRSLDHGETWTRINCPYHTYFWEVDQKDCDEIWICGNQSLLISTKDHGETWQKHIVPTTYNLLGIDIVPNGDYRACGNQSTVISSSDGGETWEQEYQAPFIDMHAIATRGIGGPAYAVGAKGNIIETLDGGTTWTVKESGTLYQLNDVCFQALFHAVYATGWYGQVIKKDEPADAKFKVLNKKPNHYMLGIDFIYADTGWLVGSENLGSTGVNEGIIMNTVDGGKTWVNQLTKPFNLNSIGFINSKEGWAVGAEGWIGHTINGGKSWTAQTCPLYGSLHKVFFIDKNNGWIASRDFWGQIAHTTDGGKNWVKQTNPTTNPIADVFFINTEKGWAVGMDSTILRTTNGGATWHRVDLTVTNNWYFRSVFFIDEMHGWTVGVYGIIMITTDGGITWQENKTGFSESLNSVFFIDPKNGWATGDAGTILRSVDGGNTWFEQYSGVGRIFLTSVKFTDLNKGWVCGEGGTIKSTENGGFRNEPGTLLRNRLNLPITDLHETRDTIVFKTPGIKAKNLGYQLVGLEVMIDSIIHTRAGDLEITLAHNGISKSLVNKVTDTGSDFLWTRFSDDAKKTISEGSAPFSGKHKPTNPLASFNGINPYGEWILTIYDHNSGHAGTLKAWGIKPVYEKISTVGKPEVKVGEPEIQLFQNVPNPLTGITEIKWSSGIDGFTTLKVYNISGKEIITLANKFMSRGEYSVDFDSSILSAGVYYYQLKVGNYMLAKKCIVL